MAASVFDSALYARLFPPGEVGRLFTDSAQIRAMMLVEGALARAQGDLGIIPSDSAEAIHRAAMELLIDPGALAPATGTNGVPVPALVAAFRDAMQAPEHAQYLHWGATSQDIADTGLMLRLRQSLSMAEADLRTILGTLADIAEAHAETPMAARTWGQHATPTSFGALAAHWGAPLLTLTREVPVLRQQALWVSLSGAAGTAAALGPRAAETRRALAEALGLVDPGRGWHTDRTPVLRIADWMTRVSLALGKTGEDLIELAMSEVDEIALGDAGGSSTMPQKRNPVAPSALVALARQAAGLNAIVQGAALARHQRDGAAWFTEWMSLPQIVLGTGAGLTIGTRLASALAPRPDRMRAAAEDPRGLIYAEALSFLMAATRPRPEAQAAVKALCGEAVRDGTRLVDLAARDHPEVDLSSLTLGAQLGQAPTEALAFARAVRALPG